MAKSKAKNEENLQEETSVFTPTTPTSEPEPDEVTPKVEPEPEAAPAPEPAKTPEPEPEPAPEPVKASEPEQKPVPEIHHPTKPACPSCGAHAIGHAGGLKHCNQCGMSWA